MLRIIIHPLPEQLGLPLEELIGHGRLNVSGRQGVDANVVGGKLHGKRSTHLMNSCLGRVVGGASEAL